MCALLVVATPIGNLEDITLRALRALKEADLIAAEDTRHTKKLLAHYGISTPMTSYFEHNELRKAPFLIEKLKKGENIALVSDAGTPGISDPGYRLIRLAVENLIQVIAVPGPSSVAAVLSVSGLPLEEFTFKGFVPHPEGEKKSFILGLRGKAHTYCMFESARRLRDTLGLMLELLGDVEVVVAREMTKVHEEILRGKVSDAMGALEGREIKGEVTLVVRTSEEKKDVSPDKALEELLKSGVSLKDAVKAVSIEMDLPRGEVYKEALKVKERLGR